MQLEKHFIAKKISRYAGILIISPNHDAQSFCSHNSFQCNRKPNIIDNMPVIVSAGIGI